LNIELCDAIVTGLFAVIAGLIAIIGRLKRDARP
jgi:hypothetical protein